jgi:sirohydrochlorin cobaltochelatase
VVPTSDPDHATTVTLLVAHGSRNARAQAAHTDLVEAVTTASGAQVTAAYLELATPSVPDAIAAAVGGGATTVRILPCFLHPGNHVLVDLPGIAEQAHRTHPGVLIEMLPHLGADPALVALLARAVAT